MKCPHCLDSFHDKPDVNDFGQDVDGPMHLVKLHCPSCRKFILLLRRFTDSINSQGRPVAKHYEQMIYPKSATRPPPPTDVPDLLPVISRKHVWFLATVRRPARRSRAAAFNTFFVRKPG